MELLKRITLLLLVASAAYSQWYIPSSVGTGGYLALSDSLYVAGPIRLGTVYGKLYFADGTYMSTATLGTASSIGDSLDVYRTAYKLDTTKVDTSQWGKFVRDHQTAVLSSAAAISDSLNPYRTTAFKWDTTKIDTSQFGKFVRDHQSVATDNLGDITAVSVQSPVTGGGTTGAVTVSVDTTLLATRYWVGDQGYNTSAADITSVLTNSPITGGLSSGAVTIAADTTILATQYYVDTQMAGSGSGDITGVSVLSPVTGGGATGTVTISVDTTLLATKYYVDTQVVAETGDISGVTAGVGLSGGGASGAVTVSADTTTLATRAYVGGRGFLTSETGDIESVTAGDGLSGGGITGGLTIDLKLSQIGGLEVSGDSLRLKLDGSTLTKTSSGIKVNASYLNSLMPLSLILPIDIAPENMGMSHIVWNASERRIEIGLNSSGETKYGNEIFLSDSVNALTYVNRDTLAKYTTNYYLDTTRIDTAMWAKFVKDHESDAADFTTAISDSLAKYTTSYKLDTTKIDTSMWGYFVRDHQVHRNADSTWWSADIGSGNTIDDSSFAVGVGNIVNDRSVAFGDSNIVSYRSAALGHKNWVWNHNGSATGYVASMAIGWSDTVNAHGSLVVGDQNFVRVDAFSDTANSGVGCILGNLNRNFGASSLIVGEANRNGVGAIVDSTITDQDGTASLIAGSWINNRAAHSITFGLKSGTGTGGGYALTGGRASYGNSKSSISVGDSINGYGDFSASFGQNVWKYGNHGISAGYDIYNGGGNYMMGRNLKSDSTSLLNFNFGEYNYNQVYQHSYIFGQYDTTYGWFHYQFGRYLKTGDSGSAIFLLGTGFSQAYPLTSTDDYSFNVGFKSNIPTLTITEASGVGTIGRVGIGDSTPDATFEVDNGGILASDSLSVGGGVWVRNMYRSGNDLGIIFYNAALSRIDTVFAKQP